MGWSAGKWREWYPDVVAPEGFEGLVTNELNFEGATKGVLTSKAQKYLWQRGWWSQHQRLLQALWLAQLPFYPLRGYSCARRHCD